MFFSHSANESEGSEKKLANWRSRLFFFCSSVFFSSITFTFPRTSNIFWRCLTRCHRLQRCRKLWSKSGRAMFINEEPYYACAAVSSTQAHIAPQTQPSPAMLCPCAAFCLQTGLPWLALPMLIRSPPALAFMVRLLRTQVQNPNIKKTKTILIVWCSLVVSL